MITQEQLDDAILEELARPGWDIIRQFLAQQTLIARDACADAQSWERVHELRGFAQGLNFVINLREDTIKQKEVTDATL